MARTPAFQAGDEGSIPFTCFATLNYIQGRNKMTN